MVLQLIFGLDIKPDVSTLAAFARVIAAATDFESSHRRRFYNCAVPRLVHGERENTQVMGRAAGRSRKSCAQRSVRFPSFRHV